MEYGKDNNMILIHKKGEPVYSDDREGKILYLEVCGESAILIMSLGSHPCTYITFPGIEHIGDYSEADDLCDVHGGFTFLGSRRKIAGIEGIWLGWDYAHAGDLLYLSRYDIAIPGDHTWTLDELITEARDNLFTIQLKGGTI